MSQDYPKKILLIEDDLGFRETLKTELCERGWQVKDAVTAEEVDYLLHHESFSHALIDLQIRGESPLSGIQFLSQISAIQASCRCVILTGYGSVATAVRAIQLGAVDFLTKPVHLERLLQALEGQSSKAIELLSEDDLVGETLAERQRAYLETLLLAHQNSVSQTAKTLGIFRQSLQRMLRKRPR